MYLFGPQVNKQNTISRWKPLGHSSLHQGWRWVPRLPPVSTEKSLAQWEKRSPHPWYSLGCMHFCVGEACRYQPVGSCACPSQGDIVSDILKAEIQPPDLCSCQIRIVLCGQVGRQSWGNGETVRWRQVPLRLPAVAEQGEPVL